MCVKGRILLHQIFPSPSCISGLHHRRNPQFPILPPELSPWRPMVIRINMAAEKPQGNAVGFLLVSIVFRWLERKSFNPHSTKSHSWRQHCPLDPPHLFSVLAFIKDSEGSNQISSEERLPNNRIEGNVSLKNQMQAWISSVGIRATIKRKRVGIGQQRSPEWSNSYIIISSQLGPSLELLRSCPTPTPCRMLEHLCYLCF